MPASGATPALYDVPRHARRAGLPPMQPVESAGLRSLLAALATAEPHTLALVSEIDWGREVTVWTTPAGGHGSLRVRLGHADEARQLRALRSLLGPVGSAPARDPVPTGRSPLRRSGRDPGGRRRARLDSFRLDRRPRFARSDLYVDRPSLRPTPSASRTL